MKMVPLFIFLLCTCAAHKMHSQPRDCYATSLSKVSKEFIKSVSVHVGPITNSTNLGIAGHIKGQNGSTCKIRIAFSSAFVQERSIQYVNSEGKCQRFEESSPQTWVSAERWEEIQFHMVRKVSHYELRIITPSRTAVSEKIPLLLPPFSLELKSDDQDTMAFFDCQTECLIYPNHLEDLVGRTVFYISHDNSFKGVEVYGTEYYMFLDNALLPLANHWYKVAFIGKEQKIVILVDGVLVKEFETAKVVPYPEIRRVVYNDSAVASWCPQPQNNITSDMILAWSMAPVLLIFTIIAGILLSMNKREEIKREREKQALEPSTEMKQTPYFFILEKTPPPLPPPVNPKRQTNSATAVDCNYAEPFDCLPDDYTLLPFECGTDEQEITEVPGQPYDKLHHCSGKHEGTHNDNLRTTVMHQDLSDNYSKDLSSKSAAPVAFVKQDVSEESPYVVTFRDAAPVAIVKQVVSEESPYLVTFRDAAPVAVKQDVSEEAPL